MCCQEIQSDIEDAIAKYNEATSRLAEAEKNKAQADQVPPSHREAKLDGVLLGLKNDFDRPAIGENTWFFLLVGGWFPFFLIYRGLRIGKFFFNTPSMKFQKLVGGDFEEFFGGDLYVLTWRFQQGRCGSRNKVKVADSWTSLAETQVM